MDRYERIFQKSVVSIIGVCFILVFSISVWAEEFLAEEERAYIAEHPVITAASLHGVAPLQYADENGKIRGISIGVLKEITNMTGLVFQCELYDSMEEIYRSEPDIVFGIPYHYASADMVLSRPFLKSETILYINSSDLSDQLDKKMNEKTYAAVKGSALPEGIKEENAIYFNTREESLNAVEAGKADYGYGNAYSVAFYMIQNDYQNIIMVPQKKEFREYCMGVLKQDDLLLSIINKSINAIDENRMQTLILTETSHINRKITLPMIMDAYGKEILIVLSAVVGILLFSVIFNVRTNNRLRMQNRRHERLSQISNEYLYEYSSKKNRLTLSEKCIQRFGGSESLQEVAATLNHILSRRNPDEHMSTIELPLADGKTGIFKMINSNIYDDRGVLDSIIGKLVDISEEAIEKERLIRKSQTDGLTGLYNSVTTKEFIFEKLAPKDEGTTDALLIMDCDNLKNINDTFGHLRGNQVLEDVARSMKFIFESTHIVGRIGGDEFCVYLSDIPSIEFLQAKCRQLNDLILTTAEDIRVSVSIGIALVQKEREYETLFNMADNALYFAKRKGGAQMVIYGTE